MASLATGRGAGVEHAHTILQVGKIGGDLRSAILHGERAILEARHAGDVGAMRQHQRIGQPWMEGCFVARRLELREQRSALDMLAIDPQHQRRLAVVGGHHRIGLCRPVAGERLGQPFGVRMAGLWLGIKPGDQVFALALPAAQYGVDQSGQLRTLKGAGGFDGGRHGRVILQLQDFQLHQTQHQQRVDRRVLVSQRFFQQVIDRSVEAQPPACALAEQGHQ
jgi:hypothetical protein